MKRDDRGYFIILLVLATMLLVACNEEGDKKPAPVPVSRVTITDPLAYLAQSINPDGNVATPLHANDPLTYRRKDFGRYQIEDSFLAPDGSAITTWSYPPFGPFVAANGDGGEQYVIEGDITRITSTQDGGKPGVQVFEGPGCGRDGWVVFRTDATEEWRDLVAKMGCPIGASAYTRYRVANIDWPGIGRIETIVSEHYNSSEASRAGAMERIFLGRGWGRLGWQAWNSAASPIRSEIDRRCPDFGWNDQHTGMVLNDCRIVTNIVDHDGRITGAQEWHP